MKTPQVIHLTIKTRKFSEQERKTFRAYTQSPLRGANKIEIVIDEKEAQGWSFVENLFHEFTHAYIHMAERRHITLDNEERLAQIVGQTVRGLMSGFQDSEYSAKYARRLRKRKYQLYHNKRSK